MANIVVPIRIQSRPGKYRIDLSSKLTSTPIRSKMSSVTCPVAPQESPWSSSISGDRIRSAIPRATEGANDLAQHRRFHLANPGGRCDRFSAVEKCHSDTELLSCHSWMTSHEPLMLPLRSSSRSSPPARLAWTKRICGPAMSSGRSAVGLEGRGRRHPARAPHTVVERPPPRVRPPKRVTRSRAFARGPRSTSINPATVRGSAGRTAPQTAPAALATPAAAPPAPGPR